MLLKTIYEEPHKAPERAAQFGYLEVVRFLPLIDANDVFQSAVSHNSLDVVQYMLSFSGRDLDLAFETAALFKLSNFFCDTGREFPKTSLFRV
jgi:hypothetical protein